MMIVQLWNSLIYTCMHASDSSDEDIPERDSKYVSHKKKLRSSGAQLEGATGNSGKPEDTESVSSCPLLNHRQ